MQQAVSADALTIFGAQFDETLDDEIRVTVIATGFEKDPEQISVADKPLTAVPKASITPAAPSASVSQQSSVPEPQPLSTVDDPKPEESEDDPFEDIFKIFSKRDD